MHRQQECDAQSQLRGVPHGRRILGSTATSNTSESKLPASSSTEENNTVPMTTYISRAKMASSSNGPMPGQLMMISMRSEALSMVATEIPNREISGLATAGRQCLQSIL